MKKAPRSRECPLDPLRDGERYLEEVTDALAREQPDEVLVIDSASRDRWLRSRAQQASTLMEIEPREFSHGQTRNLGAQQVSGDLVLLSHQQTP